MTVQDGPGSTGGSRSQVFEYDGADRLKLVTDTDAGVCTSRWYAFDVNGNRLSKATSVYPGASCEGVPVTTAQAWTYDEADRLTTGVNAAGAYVYDELGRQTSLPGVDTAAGASGGDVSVGYFDDDLARTITQDGKTTTFTLDPVGRRASQVSVSGSTTTTVVRHYTDTSDNPGWVTSTSGSATSTTRYVSGINGDLAATVTGTAVTLEVTDPLGSVATTLSVDGSTSTIGALGTYDEYGSTITTGPSTGAVGYGWLGGKERAADPTTSLVLMGVRLYNQTTGQFTSTDPVPGGNTTAYAYPQDPANATDLSGECPVCVVAPVAVTMSWNPIGWAALAVVGTVAVTYGATKGVQYFAHKKKTAAKNHNRRGHAPGGSSTSAPNTRSGNEKHDKAQSHGGRRNLKPNPNKNPDRGKPKNGGTSKRITGGGGGM